MKTLIILLIILLFSNVFAQTYLRVGTTISEIKIIDDKLIVLGGYTPTQPTLLPSISVVDILSEKTEKIVNFPSEMSLYRSLVEGTNLYITTWGNKELLKVDLKNDLNGKSFTPPIVFKDTTDKRGMESIVKVGQQTWVAFSNFGSPSFSNVGNITLLENNKAIASVNTETPNLKTMIKIGKHHVAIAMGEYNKLNGQIAILNTQAMDKSQKQFIISTTAKNYYETYDIPGTPGDLFYHKKDNTLYACDLDFGAKSLYKIDLNSKKMTTISGDFEDCGSVYVKNNNIYLAHFSAGEGSIASDKHLYVYDKKTHKQICSQSFYPGELDYPGLLFTNDIEIFERNGTEKLIVSFGSFPYVGLLDINKQGIPEGCK